MTDPTDTRQAVDAAWHAAVDAAIEWFTDKRSLNPRYVSRPLVEELVSVILAAERARIGAASQDETENRP